MNVIETIEYRTHTVNVCYDDDPLNPREDHDNLGKMACFHKRYFLGDKHDLSSGDFEDWDEMEKYLRCERDAVIVLPLSLYDHSGITMWVGEPTCRFDSGQVGFIYATREDILKCYVRKQLSPKLLSRVEQVLRAEVKTYDHYLTGEVYGYVVEGPNSDDSCWGFFG